MTYDSKEAAAAALANLEEWTIEPRSTSFGARAREVWVYRRLMRYFAARAIERLYQKTMLGKAWIFIRPLFPLIIKAMVFGGLLGVNAPGVPYFLFLLVGSSIWDLFAGALMWATRSLQINRGVLSRMYVPRVILPAATMAPAFVNFAIMMAVLLGTLIYYRVVDGVFYVNSPAQLVWAVAAVLMTFTLALGIGLWTSVAGAEVRDVRFTLAYVLDFWLFLTPVLYPLSVVSEQWQWLFMLNPMTGPVQAFKWGILGIESVNYTVFAVDALVIIGVLVLGLAFFSRAEATAIDRI